MTYHFMHYFDDPWLDDDAKLRIAKQKAVNDLANHLLENAKFEVTPEGNVRGIVQIGGEG